jgi:dolichol kinase
MMSVYWQILFAALAVVYAIIIVFITRSVFAMMQKRNVEKMVAVYYNRKIVHMAAGGVVALLVPFLFGSWIYPLAIGLVLTVFTAVPHATGKPMDFMQTKENWNDVKFTLMWGISIAVLWILLNDPFLAVLPALFMAFGDGITGVVRNMLYKKRTKSPVGNVFMLIVCIIIGYFYGSMAAHHILPWVIVAAVAASIVERFEFGPIDDNVLITVTTMIILIVGSFV